MAVNGQVDSTVTVQIIKMDNCPDPLLNMTLGSNVKA